MLLKGEGTKFSDMRLRQAVSLAIDRQLIVDQLWGGYAMPTQNLINRMCPDWVELPVEYDMDKAKELAREVLGDERLPLDMYTRSLYLDRGPYKEMMEYIQSQLSQIGIDATVNVIDSSTYSEMSKAGELGANFMTHGMSNLNAYHFLDIYMSSEGSYNKSQQLAYSNPHVDELLAEMKTTLDDDRFHAIFLCQAIPLTVPFHLCGQKVGIPYQHIAAVVHHNDLTVQPIVLHQFFKHQPQIHRSGQAGFLVENTAQQVKPLADGAQIPSLCHHFIGLARLAEIRFQIQFLLELLGSYTVAPHIQVARTAAQHHSHQGIIGSQYRRKPLCDLIGIQVGAGAIGLFAQTAKGRIVQ